MKKRRAVLKGILRASLGMVLEPLIAGETSPYADGRPATTLRMEAVDAGRIIQHAQGPGQCDYLGAREAICFQSGGTYYLHYDGAGPTGWRACLAVSRDLKHWDLKGPVLALGSAGEDDAGTASSPWTVYDGKQWHMFYVGSRGTSQPPNRIPAVPYFTLAATSFRPQGPWTKQKGLTPFRTKPGSYYSDTASPGQIVKRGDEYLMFFSAAAFEEQAQDGHVVAARVPVLNGGTPCALCAYTDEPNKRLLRTLSIARTKNLNGGWSIDAQPAIPPQQQIENSALYFEPANRTWFLFTNHIGLDGDGEYTESIWVYWSRDLNRWNPEHRAVVLDRKNCAWSRRCIGMPSVVQVDQRLALFYDASTSRSGNMGRDIGLAWLNLPLAAPGV